MRPTDWTSYYIGLAHMVAKKSHDSQTQHGCIITDKKNRVLGLGYNDFPRGLDDTQLPTTRPEKYPWMIHAEKNALANCVVRPDGGVAYVTGQCCNDCIMNLWQEGIETVYMHDIHGTHLFDENQKAIFDRFVSMSKINIVYVKPDLSWMLA